MAAGGAPASTPPVNTLTKPGPVAAAYTGDINTYGEGPEHDFFPAPTSTSGSGSGSGGGAGSGGGSGGSSGGGGGGGSNSGGGGTGGNNPAGAGASGNPGIAAIAQALGKTPQQLMQTAYAGQPANQTAAAKDAAFNNSYFGPSGATPLQAPTSAPAGSDVANAIQSLIPGYKPPAAPSPAPAPTQPTLPENNPLNQYLRGLSGQPQAKYQAVATRRFASGGGTAGSTSAENAVSAPQQNVQQMESRGEQPAGGPSQGNFTGRDFANANVAVAPSLKSAIGIGAMVAGLAGGPLTGALGALTKLGSFDVPGPRLPSDVQDQLAGQYDNATSTGRVLTGLGGVSRALASDRAAAVQGNNTPIGGYGMTTPATGGYGQAQITGNFTSPGFNGTGGGAGAGNAGGGGGGGSYGGGSLGGGPGAEGAGSDPGGPPGSHRRGGAVHNYARGGVMRFPALRRFDDGGSTSDDDSDSAPQGPPPAVQQAQQAAQQQAAYAQPTTSEYIADPGAAYQAMIANTRNQPPGDRTFQLSVPKKPIPLRSYDDGGTVVDDTQDPNAFSGPSGDATPTSDGMIGGSVFSGWLPLLAGAYQASQGDPASAAASVGVAAAMTGQTPQQAMDSATLLHRSGASNLPKAQTVQVDPNRTSTNQILAALAANTGLADKLALSATNPQQAMGTAAKPYAKPQVRTRAPAAAAAVPPQTTGPQMLATDQLTPLGQAGGGEIHSGQGPVAGPGDGQEDKIPAMLSDGEYVFSAQDVSDLGNGSNKAGAARLDQMRQLIRKNAGRKNVTSIAKPQPDVGAILKRCAGGRA